MKRFLLSMMALVAVCALFTGCSKAGSTTTFTVGFDAEFPPYGFKDEKTGEYTGFDLDLAQEVAFRRGWKLVKKPINWDAKDMELASKAIDCIWNGFTIQGREGKYTFSEPYVDNSQVVLVKQASPIKALADLKGKVVMAQTDTPVLEALQKGGKKEMLGSTFADLRTSANYVNAIMELEAGAVDAVAVDIGVAKDKMASAPGKFRMLDEIILTEQYGIGFLLGNEALKNKVQETLKEMVKDGTAAKISKKWFDGRDVIILKP